MVSDKNNHLIILSNPDDFIKMGNYCKKLFSFNSNLFVLVKSVRENTIHSIFDCLHQFSENGGSIQVKLVSNVYEHKYINFLVNELKISNVVFFESQSFFLNKIIGKGKLLKLIIALQVPLLYIGHKHQLRDSSLLFPYDHPFKIASILTDNSIQFKHSHIQIFIPDTKVDQQFIDFLNIKSLMEDFNRRNVELFTIASEEETQHHIMRSIHEYEHCVVCINKKKNYFKQLYRNMRGFLASSTVPKAAILYYQ